MAQFTSLPMELLELIVNNLQDDETALRVLSLVCRMFISLCRTHLFAAISMLYCPLEPEWDKEWTTVQRFSRAMQQIPHFGSYVRVVVLCGFQSAINSGDIRYDAEGEKLNDEALQQILPALTNLKEFTLFQIDWSIRFSPSLQRSFYELIHHSKITKLTLDAVTNLPYTFLACFQHIPILQIRYYPIINVMERNKISSFPYGHPATLRVDSLEYFATKLYEEDMFLRLILQEPVTSTSFLPYIRGIVWHSDGSEFLLNHVLRVSSMSLEALEYFFHQKTADDSDFRDLLEELDLSSMAVLRRLILSCNLHGHYHQEEIQFFSWVATTIKSLDGSVAMQEIVVNFALISDTLLPIQLLGLSALDSSLQPFISGGLRRVELNISWEFEEEESTHSLESQAGAFQDFLAKEMPVLWRNSVLNYELPRKEKPHSAKYTLLWTTREAL